MPLRRAGYEAVWRGQKSWNGVAILARGMEPVLTRNALPGDPEDDQSRYIEAAVNGVLIGCLYAPNGNPQPGPKFDYKLAWLDRLISACGGAQGRGRAGRPDRRLQRRADGARYLSHQVLRQGRAGAAAEPRRIRTPAQAGLDRRAFVRCIRTSASIRSGTTCETAGRATPACGSTIFFSARILRRA